MIRFEIFQYISFVLACSLFLYMVVQYVRWFITGLVPKTKLKHTPFLND